MPWVTAYEVDWRDAHTALGDVDLNFVGSSFTYEGVTWKTPSVARGNPFNQDTAVIWGLEAAGLRATSIDNSRFTTGNNNAPHIFAFLTELAANTATPFVADPTRSYILQGFVSAYTGISAVNTGAYVAFYKVTNNPAGVGPNFTSSARGSRGGTPPVNFGIAGVGAAPPGYSRLDLNLPVMSVHYKAGGRNMTYCSAFGAGAFLDNGSLRFEAGHKDTTEFHNDVVMDPEFFRVAPAIHNTPNFSPNAYDATFQRFRLQQWE